MNCIALLLAKFQTDTLEANIWIMSTIEWQQHACVYVQEMEGKLNRKLIEVIVSGIMAETIARKTYNSCKAVNLFIEEEA